MVLSQKRTEKIRTSVSGTQYKVYIWVDDVISEAGSYVGFRIKSKNGHYYNDGNFFNAIGYKTLDDIFEKLN